MRILCSVNPAPGHLFAMVPLAWALHLEGHQVIVAAPRVLAPLIRRSGLTAAVVGGDTTVLSCRPAGRPIGGAGLDLDAYVTIAERTTPELVDLVRTWQPDLIVTEPAAFAGPLAATVTGTPWVLHQGGLQPADEVVQDALSRVADRLDRLGPAPKPPMATIDTSPPSMRPAPTFGSVLAMRPVAYHGACTAPEWLLAAPERPRVCVSMGTVAIPEGVEGLTAALHGLGDLAIDVIVSGAGAHAVADLPANATRVGWVPHHHLLPGCDLFVHHSGATSSTAALVAGRPHLVMPQMADQFSIAERLTRAGVARCVPFADRGPQAVRDAALDLLDDPFYAARAERLRKEIAAMPAPGTVAADLISRLR
ncbi:MAG: L-demethylnoviosyl transferase [Actinoplanes sp.]|nr:L-demethylnoviosyl transferase [Actinoplanes sp.]